MFTEVLTFWFEEIDKKQWWKKDASFDELIRSRFSDLHAKASACELYLWRRSAKGRLAEIIILDQFSRNMYRDTAQAFITDNLALALAQEAVDTKVDDELGEHERTFLYMPFMHSESMLIHQQAESLYKEKGSQDSYQFELKHKKIIDEYERFPHRNNILNRKSTAQELEFLKQPCSSF